MGVALGAAVRSFQPAAGQRAFVTTCVRCWGWCWMRRSDDEQMRRRRKLTVTITQAAQSQCCAQQRARSASLHQLSLAFIRYFQRWSYSSLHQLSFNPPHSRHSLSCIVHLISSHLISSSHGHSPNSLPLLPRHLTSASARHTPMPSPLERVDSTTVPLCCSLDTRRHHLDSHIGTASHIFHLVEIITIVAWLCQTRTT